MQRLLTLDECAQILGTTKQGIYMRIYRGVLPYVKLGNTQKAPLRVEECVLQEYIDKCKVEAYRAKEAQA
jgi:excisionase family DNA binding protein